MRGIVLLVVFTLAVPFIPTNAQFTYSEYELFGCYDKTSSDLVKEHIHVRFTTSMTLQLCRDICATADNTYFAVTGGDECVCFKDKLLRSIQLPPLVLSCYDNRAIKCKNDQTQYCGSADAYLIYTVCPKYKYGPNCMSTCSCPANQMCTYEGVCVIWSCYPGFSYAVNTGCTACDSSSYGFKCYGGCSSYCKVTCAKSTGECTRCKQGKGPYCQESCPTGTFDNTCSQKCSARCKESECDHQSGTCFSCEDSNKWGDRCDNVCKNGFYGQTCEDQCSSSCSGICDKSSGHCTSGCIDNKWGDLCESVCAGNCKDSCDQNNGTCTSCVDGFYGDFCENTCPENCAGKKCDIQSAECSDGCMPGYKGVACNEKCPCNCEVCKQVENTCTECVSGYCAHGNTCKTCPTTTASSIAPDPTRFPVAIVAGVAAAVVVITHCCQHHLHLLE